MPLRLHGCAQPLHPSRASPLEGSTLMALHLSMEALSQVESMTEARTLGEIAWESRISDSGWNG